MNPIFTIEGRARRSTYIGHTLLITLVTSCVYAVISVFGDLSPDDNTVLLAVITLLGALLWTFPEARRFHDMDMTAWWVIGTWIPLVSIVFFLMLLFRRGTSGVNSYGPDPLVRNPRMPSQTTISAHFDHEGRGTQPPVQPLPDTPIQTFALVGPGGLFGTDYLITMRRNTLLLTNRRNNQDILIDPSTGEYGLSFRNTFFSGKPISMIKQDGHEVRFKASGATVSALKKWWRTHEYMLQIGSR